MALPMTVPARRNFESFIAMRRTAIATTWKRLEKCYRSKMKKLFIDNNEPRRNKAEED